MREYDFPQLGEHHREHVLLLAELQEFVREIEEGRRSFDLETLTSLKHWLINHVLESDMAFARYLQES
jgi:hemerythrin